MIDTTAGSKASVLQRRICMSLAVLSVPIALSGCVGTQQQSFASLATTAARQEVASRTAKEAETESEAEAETGKGSAVRAFAPVRNENGTISGSSAIDRMIVQAADANNIPRDLAFGVVHVESTYNPRARGRGVFGLSQIMPSTARSLGFSGSSEDLLEPATNLRYGMRYLAGAWEKGGRDVCRASMKYKGGHRATTMTRAASSYCGRVRQQMQRIAGNPILSGAPIALAANAPATAAAVQVAAAQPSATLPGVREASATRVASTSAAVPAASALTSNAGPSNAVAAIAASRSEVAAIARPATPSRSPIAQAVAAASSAPEPSLSMAADAASPAPAGLSEPDPSRFGG